MSAPTSTVTVVRIAIPKLVDPENTWFSTEVEFEGENGRKIHAEHIPMSDASYNYKLAYSMNQLETMTKTNPNVVDLLTELRADALEHYSQAVTDSQAEVSQARYIPPAEGAVIFFGELSGQSVEGLRLVPAAAGNKATRERWERFRDAHEQSLTALGVPFGQSAQGEAKSGLDMSTIQRHVDYLHADETKDGKVNSIRSLQSSTF